MDRPTTPQDPDELNLRLRAWLEGARKRPAAEVTEALLPAVEVAIGLAKEIQDDAERQPWREQYAHGMANAGALLEEHLAAALDLLPPVPDYPSGQIYDDLPDDPGAP